MTGPSPAPRHLRAALSALLRRAPEEERLAPGAFYSPLEMRAERAGLEIVERFFQESRLARAIARAHAGFFGDPEAERALRKGYHVLYDERLRVLALRLDLPAADSGLASVPEGTHPIDRYVASDLEQNAPRAAVVVAGQPARGARLAHWARTLATGLRLLAEATVYLVRHGVSRTVPLRCRVAAPNFWPETRWLRLQKALEELGASSPSDLCIVRERPEARGSRQGKLLAVDPVLFHVPRGPWLRLVWWPAVRLFFELGVLSLAAARDGRCLELIGECFRQACYGLLAWRIAFNLTFESYLDNAEYLPQHNVKGLVFRKFGGRLVRIPHSQMDTPGAALSYLGYDVFLSSGSYQWRTYGQSWSPRLRAVSVGQIQHDRRVAGGWTASPVARRIASLLEERRPLAVFFGSSLRAGRSQVLEALAALRGALAGIEGWFVVIKPKGMHQEFYDWMEEDPRLRGWLQEPEVVAVRYDGTGRELAPTGWLIEHMVFGLCLGGSVQIEALTRGAAVFAFRRIWQETPYTKALVASGLLHAEQASLREALRVFARCPENLSIPHEWFREQFDPFTDDQALLRVAGLLLDPDGKGRERQ